MNAKLVFGLCCCITLLHFGISEEICSVCCWEDNTDQKQDVQCRTCIHDQAQCPSMKFPTQREPRFRHRMGPRTLLAGPPGDSSPLRASNMAPGHANAALPGFYKRGAAPGEKHNLMGEYQSDSPSSPGSKEATKYQGAPPAFGAAPPAFAGLFAGSFHSLPTGPDDEPKYLKYSARPGMQAGSPANRAPGAAAPAWRAFAPGHNKKEQTGDESSKRVQIIYKPGPQIAFSASLSKRLSARSDTVVTFDKVLSNLDTSAISRNESSFNAETGNFTCHVPGHYFFSFTVQKLRGHHTTFVELFKNDDVIARVESYSYGDLITSTVIIHLDLEDYVYLKLRNRYSMNRESSFSGYLIYADQLQY